MTPKQIKFYWDLWRKACLAQNWDARDSELRHQVHKSALGYDCSSKHFDNADFDKVKNTLLRLIDETNLEPVLFFGSPDSEERKRLLWRIEQTAPKPYIERISAAIFGTLYYHELPTETLVKLRNTLTNRMRAKARKAAAEQADKAREEIVEMAC